MNRLFHRIRNVNIEDTADTKGSGKKYIVLAGILTAIVIAHAVKIKTDQKPSFSTNAESSNFPASAKTPSYNLID